MGPDGNDYWVKPGSDAWQFLEELLITKIADGNGTDQDKLDVEEMKRKDKEAADGKKKQ